MSAFIKVDKLVINNQTFTCDTVSKIPGYIKHRVEQPPTQRGSTMSNLYPSFFTIDGMEFTNVEQYISYMKALLFGAEEVAKEVLDMNDPIRIKQKVKRLRSYDETTWNDKAIDILAKYSQNDEFQEPLLQPYNLNWARLAQPTRCSESGCPCTTHTPRTRPYGGHNPHATDTALWRGKNIQGRVLREVREAIKSGTC